MYACESPYDTYASIREGFPAWLTENLTFLWDTSLLLTSEKLHVVVSDAVYDARIIEYIENEYVAYLLSLQKPVRVIKPYLKLLNKSGLVQTLRELVSYDFVPGNKESFKIFDSLYKEYEETINTDDLIFDHENLKQMQGDFFLKEKEDEKLKENFYKGLRHLANKKSMKSFNDQILELLDRILLDDIDLSVIVDDELSDYTEWQHNSPPFKLLASYLELLQCTTNEARNKILREMYIRKSIAMPYAFKIMIIKKMSEIMLKEDVNIDSDLILAMITEFEKFDSRSPGIVGKYFAYINKKKKHEDRGIVYAHASETALPSAERKLVRYALNQAFTRGMIC